MIRCLKILINLFKLSFDSFLCYYISGDSMEVKTLIFDMDGLMFDTESLWEKAFIKTGKEFGYNFTSKLHEKTIGTNQNTIKDVLKAEVGEDFPCDNFYFKYVNNMDEVIKKEGISLKNGLRELLDYLISNDYAFAIASSTPTKRIKWYLECAGIPEDIFKFIIGGQDFKYGKPHPDIFLKTCELLGVKASEAIVLEDSNNGIKAAYKAGCIPILIPDIDVIKDETRNYAAYELTSLFDVIDLLENR